MGVSAMEVGLTVRTRERAPRTPGGERVNCWVTR